MMSLRAVHAGTGYQYLLRSVATNDAPSQADTLAGYYQAKGTPPGRWIGRGLTGFNSESVAAGRVIDEAQMAALYGEGIHPDADEMISANPDKRDYLIGRQFAIYTNDIPVLNALRDAEKRFKHLHGRRPTDADRSEMVQKIGRKFYEEATGYTHAPGADVTAWVNQQKNQVRQAVAGYDFTFSPTKSISVLWALADEDTANAIARCHHDAVADTLRWVEDNVARTRRGAGGIEQVATRGLNAAEFTHFDTRTGDPDLHSHVLISNKVQAEDGSWKALDGQPIFAHHQTISARYDVAIQDLLAERLGLEFVASPREAGKAPVWEVAGVPQELITLFSKRRALARPVYERMVAEYTDRYGTAPSKLVAKEMWQAAILETRDAKKPAESLADLRAQWAEEVTKHHRGDELLDAVDAVAQGSAKAQRPLFSVDDHAADLAERIVSQVTDGRPVFRRSHIDTAISTALKGFRFGAVDRSAAHSAVMDSIFDRWAIDLSADELETLPAALRADDGRGIDHRLNSEQFTTAAILEAEARALDAVEEPTAIFASTEAIDRALAEHTRTEGFSLNSGQEELARHLLTCGTLAATGVGPAGTGKTTSMKIVAEVWRDSGRNLIGLAPSAAAARVLSDDIGSQATTIDSLTHTWLGNNPNKPGRDPSALPVEIKPGDMLLVDEAGMASTKNIAALIEIAHHTGAVVRFIGDPMQLDAVDGGGLFNAMCRRARTVELSEVMRFAKGRDTEQAAASLAIRNGDTSGVVLYDERGWITGGRRETMIVNAVDAYLADIDAGRNALIIAPTNHDVDTINEIIRAHRIDSGAVDTTREVTLARGDVAGLGDTIICRTNTVFRPHTDGVAGRVINGDIMTIEDIRDDGSLVVRHTKSGDRQILPASYVSSSTHLGYGATVHRSQGATVDVTHAIIDDSVDRAGLYVATTRGKHENRIYSVCETPLDEDAEDSHYHLAGNPGAPAPTDVVAAAVARDRRQLAASDTLLDNIDEIHSPDRLRALWLHGIDIATNRFIDDHLPEALDQLPQAWAKDIGEGPAIRAAWRDALAAGIDPRTLMEAATTAIDDAADFDRLIASRIRHVTNGDKGSSTPLPFPPPPTSGSDRQLDEWLTATRTTLAKAEEKPAESETTTPPIAASMPGMPAAFADAIAHMAAHAGAQPAGTPGQADVDDAESQLHRNTANRDEGREL